MTSSWVRWLISLVFGVLVGRASYGIIGPLLTSTFGGAAEPADFDRILIAAVLIQLVVAIVVTIALARIVNMKRLLGWGCILLGVVVLSNLASATLFSGINLREIANPDTSGKNDTATAFWFWTLIMGLPSIAVSLALMIVGLVLIRKGHNTTGSVA